MLGWLLRLVLVCGCVVSSTALAADAPVPEKGPAPEDARRAFSQGIVDFESGNYAQALTAFELSFQLHKNPGVLYNVGLSLQALGRLGESRETFARYLEQGHPPDDRRAAVEKRMEEMLAQMATLTFVELPDGAQVRVDGRDVGVAPLAPLRVDPGKHIVEVAAEGYLTVRRELALRPDADEPLRIALQKPAPPRPPPPPPMFFQTRRGIAVLTVAALSLASFVVFAVMGGLTLQRRDGYNAGCAVGPCDHALYLEAQRYAVTADVFLGLGIVSAVSGLLTGVL
jgi:hypothetical protein